MVEFTFRGKLWRWTGDAPAAWHFVTLPEDIAQQIRFMAGQRKGFGTIRLAAQIGDTGWKTSVFPDAKSGSFLLPVKAEVRRRARLTDGDVVTIALAYDP